MAKNPQKEHELPLAKVEAAPIDSGSIGPNTLAKEPLMAEPSPMQLLDRAITLGASPETLEKLYNLKARMDTDRARMAFAQALVALQAEMEPVRKTVMASAETGKHWNYAPIETIMKVLKPLLTAHGFSVTFNSATKDGVLTSSCTLLHKGGHSQTNQFSAVVGEGPPKSTTLQKAGSADTYAKRYALCDALGIVLEGLDNDARAVGDPTPVTPDQAEELRQYVQETLKFNAARQQNFLKAVGGTSFETIPASQYTRAKAWLKKVEDDAAKFKVNP